MMSLRRYLLRRGLTWSPALHGNCRKCAVSRIRDYTEPAVVTVVRQRVCDPRGFANPFAFTPPHFKTAKGRGAGRG
jgi:hypothetical protein